MKITITFQDVRLAMTLPKKWKKGPVSEILTSYLASPTAKRLGLCASSDVFLEGGDGRRLAAEAVVGECVRDGDVLRVKARPPAGGDEAAAAAAAGDAAGEPATRHAWAKQLTSKAEDFVSCAESESWRGVPFGAYLVCDGHGGQAAAAMASAKLVARVVAALDRRAAARPREAAVEALVRELPSAIVDAFLETDGDCARTGAGCTATLVIVLPGPCAAAAALSGYDSDDEAPREAIVEGARGCAAAGRHKRAKVANFKPLLSRSFATRLG